MNTGKVPMAFTCLGVKAQSIEVDDEVYHQRDEVYRAAVITSYQL